MMALGLDASFRREPRPGYTTVGISPRKNAMPKLREERASQSDDSRTENVAAKASKWYPHLRGRTLCLGGFDELHWSSGIAG